MRRFFRHSDEIHASCGAAATCSGTSTLNFLQANELFEARYTQFDVRFAKTVKVSGTNIQGILDLFNAFNARPVLSVNTRYSERQRGSWLSPTTISWTVDQVQRAGELLMFIADDGFASCRSAEKSYEQGRGLLTEPHFVFSPVCRRRSSTTERLAAAQAKSGRAGATLRSGSDVAQGAAESLGYWEHDRRRTSTAGSRMDCPSELGDARCQRKERGGESASCGVLQGRPQYSNRLRRATCSTHGVGQIGTRVGGLPESNHGITIDARDVWVGGNGAKTAPC